MKNNETDYVKVFVDSYRFIQDFIVLLAGTHSFAREYLYMIVVVTVRVDKLLMVHLY